MSQFVLICSYSLFFIIYFYLLSLFLFIILLCSLFFILILCSCSYLFLSKLHIRALIDMLTYFRIWFRCCGEIESSNFYSAVSLTRRSKKFSLTIDNQLLKLDCLVPVQVCAHINFFYAIIPLKATRGHYKRTALNPQCQ